MRTTWTFHSAGQLVFGPHAVDQLGELATRMKLSKVLIVTDRIKRPANPHARFSHGQPYSQFPSGLAPLLDLSRLRSLDVGQTRVGDPVIAQLSGLKQLRWLGAEQCHVTSAGAHRLQQSLPQAVISVSSQPAGHPPTVPGELDRSLLAR